MNKVLTEDFAQKNRKRAIGITDIAIAKVPKTHIYGFSNEQEKILKLFATMMHYIL